MPLFVPRHEHCPTQSRALTGVGVSMITKMKSAALATLLFVGVTPQVLAQPAVRSRIRGNRVPVIVVSLDGATAKSRVFFSDTDFTPDTVFLSSTAERQVDLESAIALLASDRANRSGTQQERGAWRSVGIVSRNAHWLPASDQLRLAAFITRLEVSGTHCRRSTDALRDRCLPLALPSDSLFGQMRRSRRFTLP